LISSCSFYLRLVASERSQDAGLSIPTTGLQRSSGIAHVGRALRRPKRLLLHDRSHRRDKGLASGIKFEFTNAGGLRINISFTRMAALRAHRNSSDVIKLMRAVQSCSRKYSCARHTQSAR
jgi:hypothetical protein